MSRHPRLLLLIVALAGCPAKKADTPAAPPSRFAGNDQALLLFTGEQRSPSGSAAAMLYRGEALTVLEPSGAKTHVRAGNGSEFEIDTALLESAAGRPLATVTGTVHVFDAPQQVNSTSTLAVTRGAFLVVLRREGDFSLVNLSSLATGWIRSGELDEKPEDVAIARLLVQATWLREHKQGVGVAPLVAQGEAHARSALLPDLRGGIPAAEAPAESACGVDPGALAKTAAGYDEAQDCEPEDFDQNCAPDRCWDTLTACKEACSKGCTSCKAECVSTCENCEGADCKTACATCRSECLAERKTCRETTCDGEYKSCSAKFEEFWNRECKRDCDVYQKCNRACVNETASFCPEKCKKETPVSKQCDFCFELYQ